MLLSPLVLFSPSPGIGQVAQMVKNANNKGDQCLIPGLGRSPGEGNGNPLQYSCLKNPMDRGAWWATVLGVAKESDMTEQNNPCLLLHSFEGQKS